MTTKREALDALKEIAYCRHKGDADVATIQSFLESLPPDPFVLPAPGTEFCARLKSGDLRKFYVSKSGRAHELSSYHCSESWFRATSAEIVEET